MARETWPAMLILRRRRPTRPDVASNRKLAGHCGNLLLGAAAVALVAGCRTPGCALVVPFCAVMAPPPSPTHENKAGGRPATRQGIPAPLPKKGKTQKRSLRRPLPPLPPSPIPAHAQNDYFSRANGVL